MCSHCENPLHQVLCSRFHFPEILHWQVESGKLELEKAEFDLEAELTALVDVFSVQCDNKGLFICFQLAGQLTLWHLVPFTWLYARFGPELLELSLNC